MKNTAAMIPAGLAMLLTGCATPGQLRTVKHQRDVLAAEMDVLKDRNKALASEKQALEARVQNLSDVQSSLEREKAARQDEAAGIRKQARGFLQLQLGHLREFSRNHDLLDRIGGELIARQHTEGRNLVLIDLQHPIPSDGTLVSGSVYSTGPGSLAFCLLRPQGDQLILVWSSRLFKVAGPGPHAFDFETPIGAEKGDHIGLYAPESLPVPFDRGTGRTGTIAGPLKVGSGIRKTLLQDREGRTYSFSVSGLLE